MVSSKDVDLAAAIRVSRRVELRDIRLTHIAADGPVHYPGALNSQVDHDCSATKIEADAIELECAYRFHALSDTQEGVLEASLKYLLSYAVSGTDPLDPSDVAHFAYASGTLHSWPFVRQFLFSLTANMGYPPFTLAVHKLPPAKVITPTKNDESPIETTEEPLEATSEAK